MKIFRLGFAVYFSFIVISIGVFAADLPDTIDEIRPSIVSVGLVRPEKRLNARGASVEYRGTGFVVGDGRKVITNFHVLPEDIDGDSEKTLVVFIGRGTSASARPARIVRVDKDHDLALLSIAGTSLPSMTFAQDGYVREGQEVAFTGFPIGIALGMYPSTNMGIVSAITPVVIPALSSQTLTAAQVQRMRNRYEVYQLDAIAYPGNSGSPVYEPGSGDVIGVINSVFVKESKEGALKSPSAITYAIPVKFVKALLNDE